MTANLIRKEQATAASSIDGFCRAQGVSRTKLYQLWRVGLGPRYFYVGNRRRISDDAAADWQREMEARALSHQEETNVY